ncbi:MAG TPA: hypothetical protein VIC62_18455, partial [Nakamurella sp.]
MTDLEDVLPAALDRLGSRADHASRLAEDVRHAARRRRLMRAGPIAAVVAVCAVVAVVWATLAGSSPTPTPASGGSSGVGASTSACRPLQTGPLPTWARDGFSGDGSGTPYALSSSGAVAAIVFGNPLTAPPAADHNNKILWVINGGVPVPPDPPGESVSQNLVITAHLEHTDVTTTVDTGAAPGPSIVDLPQPGCWHLDLAWGGRSDTIDLEWVGP